MAISIVIADDEFRVIETLRNLVDWETLGYEIVGEANDGDSALAKMMQLRPHLLITDIRMPGISGLQLIRQAKEALPDLQVICVSGYSDFEYAQKAMSLGVTDYLLKPVDEDQLIPLLAKIRSHVIQSEQLKRKLSQLSRYEQNRQWVKIMRGDRHPEPEAPDIHWTFRYGTVILLKLDDETQPELDNQEIELNRFIVENILEDYSRMHTNGTLHWFEKGALSYGIVWNHPQPGVTECPVWVEELKRLLERCCKFSVTMGIGTAVDSIAQLNVSYKAAYLALEQRPLSGNEAQKKRPHKIVSQLEHYLAEHYAEPLTLKELGELFYIHPTYLGQLVKKEKNMSLSQWLNHIRIGQAVKRLAESDDLITSIAEQVGYSDLNYFYSQFRKVEGRSPREYRGSRK
ncbi:MAG: response regulator [Paenibacillaceae bacterium]|nr:response regulator [Paenibacillaceae bacterium]